MLEPGVEHVMKLMHVDLNDFIDPARRGAAQRPVLRVVAAHQQALDPKVVPEGSDVRTIPPQILDSGSTLSQLMDHFVSIQARCNTGKPPERTSAMPEAASWLSSARRRSGMERRGTRLGVHTRGRLPIHSSSHYTCSIGVGGVFCKGIRHATRPTAYTAIISSICSSESEVSSELNETL